MWLGCQRFGPRRFFAKSRDSKVESGELRAMATPRCGIIPTGTMWCVRQSISRGLRMIKPHDLIWLMLFAILGYTTEHHDIYDIPPLAALALVQVLEPKIPAL